MQIIPFQEQPAWTSQMQLTNQIFILFFKWNAMNGYWVMNILDRNNNPILLGIKVVPNYDLTSQFPILGMPAGSILCQNIRNMWNEIQRFDMGQTTELIYYEPGELEANV